MYRTKIVYFWNIPDVLYISNILYQCGKDMANKYDLHHWDNSRIKSLLIAEYCSLKNIAFLVFDEKHPVATFQVKITDDTLHFEKLATVPKSSGKGIGTYCIDRIEKIAIKNKCCRVKMEVYEPSKYALDFYSKRGYTPIGSTNTLKYKEIIMEKSLLV